MRAGDTFFLEGVADRHLWVVLSEPVDDPDRVLFVSMTSLDVTKEDVCLIDAGEHPFVKHVTCIDYSHLREAPSEALERLRVAGRLLPSAPVSADLLARIRRGMSHSKDIQFKYVQYMLDRNLID